MAKRRQIHTCAVCGVRRATILSPMWPAGYVAECEECHLTCSVAILCDCPTCNRYVRSLPAGEVADWAFGWNMQAWPTAEGYPASPDEDTRPVIHLK